MDSEIKRYWRIKKMYSNKKNKIFQNIQKEYKDEIRLKHYRKRFKDQKRWKNQQENSNIYNNM